MPPVDSCNTISVSNINHSPTLGSSIPLYNPNPHLPKETSLTIL